MIVLTGKPTFRNQATASPSDDRTQPQLNPAAHAQNCTYDDGLLLTELRANIGAFALGYC